MATLIGRLAIEPMEDVSVESKALAGGSEACAVAMVTVRYRNRAGRPQVFRFVMKHLTGRPAREAEVYERLVSVHAVDVAPRLLAVERTGTDGVFLCLEAIRRTGAWPWREIRMGTVLLGRLAEFHRAAEDEAPLVPDWDYEAELQLMAEHSRAALERCRGNDDLSDLARDLPSLNRIVAALPKLRVQLLSEHPFGRRPIHGDVHSGNVLVRRRGGGDSPILLDWGRTRLASPLEDVSSLLQSLGYWEPEWRRRHDTLLAAYLSAFGMDRTLTTSVRAAYWMAGASNVLAGALLYHLGIAADHRQSPSRRRAAGIAARDALRVIRRASAWWG
ncbi:aminoglycoside phosphotransferase family protein [Microvirga makkahensis]|nr:aminoglycoside phosphotransferase family protein [Microvirga makkahensis]